MPKSIVKMSFWSGGDLCLKRAAVLAHIQIRGLDCEKTDDLRPSKVTPVGLTRDGPGHRGMRELKIKGSTILSRIPRSWRPNLEAEPIEIVIGARNFKSMCPQASADSPPQRMQFLCVRLKFSIALIN